MSRKKLRPFCFQWTIILVFGFLLPAFGANLEVYQSLFKANQLEEAERVLKAYLEKEENPEKKTLALFALGVVTQKQNRHEVALAQFDLALKGKSELFDFIRIHKGKSHRALGQFKEAREEFLKAEALPQKSTRAFFEAEFELGEIEMLDKKWVPATAHFQKLERRLRSDEKYPLILLNLVKVENARGRKYNSCKWARKLHSKYPHHPSIQNWSIDLQNVSIDDKPLQCVASLADQKARIKNLQIQGFNDKAKAEIEILRSRANESTMGHVDSLKASYLLGEGLPQEALNVLLPYYRKEEKDFGFFVLLGRVAAQAGEFQMAVGAYQRAHSLSPRSRAGRTALFQAAFLSYQFQDYDGASRKYEEFIKKYPRSGLSSDARWHLAWIRYLKGDYAGAFEGFKTLGQRKSRRAVTNEKALYWTAMSLIKLGKAEDALPILGRLSQDKGFGYYSLVAKARLQLIRPTSDMRQTAAIPKPDPQSDIPEANPDETGEDSEGEDDEKTLMTIENPEEEPTETAEEGEVQVADIMDSPFQNRKMAQRFGRANDLISIGLNEWATWELFEIERRTAQQQHLKTLVSRYESIEAFNRSSYISQIYFSRQRFQGGFKDGKSLWQSAYPRAFDRSVTTFSRAFNVSEDFIWAIMRAESNFKTDIKSPVGAIGLMQLIPYTATQLAKILDISGFLTGQLFESATNIRMGSKYLQRLSKQFDQSLTLSAAAYNAGPHRVRSWLKSFGSNLEMDEFIEHIPYLETRNYVKKVVHNYYVYRQLYNKTAKSDEILTWLAKPVGITITGQVESRELWD